jgi:hypothetical protein
MQLIQHSDKHRMNTTKRLRIILNKDAKSLVLLSDSQHLTANFASWNLVNNRQLLAHNSKFYLCARHKINLAEIDIPNWLNSSFFETALRSGGYGPNVTVTSSEVGPATVAGVSFSCDILRAKLQVTLDGRPTTLSLIVKAKLTKGEMAKVNTLFCSCYIYVITLNLNKMSTVLLRTRIYHVHICIYVPQTFRAFWEIIIFICKNYFLNLMFKRKSVNQ